MIVEPIEKTELHLRITSATVFVEENDTTLLILYQADGVEKHFKRSIPNDLIESGKARAFSDIKNFIAILWDAVKYQERRQYHERLRR